MTRHGPRIVRPTGAEAPRETSHGWTLLFTEFLLDQMDRLTAAAEAEAARHIQKARRGGHTGKVNPGTAPTSNIKVAAALLDLMFQEIPHDPTRRDFRQGATLGKGRAHWFRAKFGGGRFRLFFRYRSDVRIIVYAWVNDEDTLRTYGSSTDAYRVFAEMLDAGNPPESWDQLVAAASKDIILKRSRGLAKVRPPSVGG